MSAQEIQTLLQCGYAFSDEWCCGCLNLLEVTPGQWAAYCNECAQFHANGATRELSDEDAKTVRVAIKMDYVSYAPLIQPRPVEDDNA